MQKTRGKTLGEAMVKILVVAPSWIGDMVMAESLLQLLRQYQPQVLIDILAPSYLESLLQRIPYVNKIWLSPLSHGEFNIKQRFALAKVLSKQNYSQAIVLPNSWKSALIPFLAKIPLRTGWRGEMRYFLLNDLRPLKKKNFPTMIQRFAALACNKNQHPPNNIPNPSLYTNATSITKTTKELNLPPPTPQQPILALCIGAEYGPAKCWPSNYFAEVAKVKSEEGWAVWLLGGTKDQHIAAAIQKACNNICTDLTGKTSLAQVIDLLSLTKAVVTNDTGLMHVAAALDLPLIAIYGSSSPQFTPPLTSKAHILSLHLPCSPCFQRQCPLQHFKCMLELKPDKVLTILKNFPHNPN